MMLTPILLGLSGEANLESKNPQNICSLSLSEISADIENMCPFDLQNVRDDAGLYQKAYGLLHGRKEVQKASIEEN